MISEEKSIIFYKQFLKKFENWINWQVEKILIDTFFLLLFIFQKKKYYINKQKLARYMIVHACDTIPILLRISIRE